MALSVVIGMVMDQIKAMLKGLGIPLAIIVAGAGGLNVYYNHNVNYEVNGKRYFKKVDGIFSHTEIIINNNGSIELKKLGIGSYIAYDDRNNDKKVDWIFLGGNPLSKGAGSESRSFERNEDLEKNIQLFQDADKLYEKELKRFKLY